MAPELGIAHGSGIRDCHFWAFIVSVTNGVAMGDLDMMLLIFHISLMRVFLEGSKQEKYNSFCNFPKD